MDEQNQSRSGGSSSNRSNNNRNRNRSRNRNRNHSEGGPRGEGGNRSGGGGGNRNRNRNRSRNRRKKTPPPVTLGEKLLYYITFGNAGRIDPTKWPKRKKTSGSSGGGGRSTVKRVSSPNLRTESTDNRGDGETFKPSGDKPAPEPRPKKKAIERVEVTSGRLYVGNLVYDANETDLEDLFKGVGTVVSTEIVVNNHTQQSKGFAFVEMNSVEEARRAVEVLHDKDFMGRKLLVNGAKSEGPRDGSDDDDASTEKEEETASEAA